MTARNSVAWWFTFGLLQLLQSNNKVYGFVSIYNSVYSSTTVTRRCASSLQLKNGGEEGGVSLLLPASPADSLLEASQQIASSLKATSSTLAVSVVTSDEIAATTFCEQANLVVALGIESPMDVRSVATLFRIRRTSSDVSPRAQFALGGKPFAPLVDQWDEANPAWQKDIPWSGAARDRSLMLEMQTIFQQGEAEDFVRAITLFVNSKL